MGAEASAGRAEPPTTGRQSAPATRATVDAEATEAAGPEAGAEDEAEGEAEAGEAEAEEDGEAREEEDTPMRLAYGSR